MKHSSTLKVLVGCETSGVVREAFLERGFDAFSCDLLPADAPTNRHIQDDLLKVMRSERWDLMAVMHPPCTRLCNSGVRWLKKPPTGKTLDQMWKELEEGARFFSECLNADIPHIAIENPVMHKHAKARIKGFFDFSQSVQPWHFAMEEAGPDNAKKRTCLWLKNLPNLVPTGILDGSTARAEVHTASRTKDRWKIRSKTYPGIAGAMAEQWGNYLIKQSVREAA